MGSVGHLNGMFNVGDNNNTTLLEKHTFDKILPTLAICTGFLLKVAILGSFITYKPTKQNTKQETPWNTDRQSPS